MKIIKKPVQRTFSKSFNPIVRKKFASTRLEELDFLDELLEIIHLGKHRLSKAICGPVTLEDLYVNMSYGDNFYMFAIFDRDHDYFKYVGSIAMREQDFQYIDFADRRLSIVFEKQGEQYEITITGERPWEDYFQF